MVAIASPPFRSAKVASEKPIVADSYFHSGCQPTWEIAYLFPAQGAWTEDDYWALEGSFDSFRRVELSSGSLDVLPMPTELHQLIMAYLLKALELFVKAQAPGLVLPSGLKVRLKKGHFREPDVVYLKAENFSRRHEKYWEGADLVMEVVSPDP